MCRIFLSALFVFLISCSQDNIFKKYENTMWSGPYGPWEMSIIIDKVKGDMFSGEMYKPAGRISYFEGKIFSNDSLVMTELYHVLGSGLVMNGTYPGKIENDTLKGLCNFRNVPLPDTTLDNFHLVIDKDFNGKTADQKIISKVFNKTLPITKKISAILADVKNPYTELEGESKKRFCKLVRRKRALYEGVGPSIKDETMKALLIEPFIQKTDLIWELEKNPADSSWLIKQINQFEEGKDRFYIMQRMKLSLTNANHEEKINFYKKMIDANLSFNDQIELLNNIMYASEIDDELKFMFDKRYNRLKKEHPDNNHLIRINESLTQFEAKHKLKAGIKAPLFELNSLSGEMIKLSDLRGKFVFLDFWGTWCGACRNEMPNVLKLDESFSKEKFQVIGVAWDNIDNLKKYIESNKIPFPNLIADESILNQYGIIGFPTTILIGPDGKIVDKMIYGENLIELIRVEINKYYNQE